MTALIVIGVIIAVLLLILLSSVRIRIVYGDEIKINLHYLFLRFCLFPKKDKKPKKNSKKNANKTSKDVKKKVDNDINKKGFAETFSEYKSLIIPALKTLGKTLSHLRINPLKLRIVLAGGDAGDLAIEYGRLCAVFYPALAELCELVHIGKKNIYIGVCYDETSYEISADFTAKIRVIYAVILAVKLLIMLIKNKLSNMNIQTNNTKTVTERTASK